MTLRALLRWSTTLAARNLVLYEIGWFVTVLGAARGHPLAGVLVTLPIVAAHLASARDARREALLLVGVTALGTAFDALLTKAGWIAFRDPGFLPGVQPWWMVALWPQFATTLNVSLRWLRERPWVAVACAALGAPLAYWGGARAGAITIEAPGALVSALALGWPLLILATLALARRLDGFVPRDAGAGAVPA